MDDPAFELLGPECIIKIISPALENQNPRKCAHHSFAG